MPNRISTPLAINGMTLRNRFVRSATHEGLASREGVYTPELAAVYERLGRAGLGLVVTGHAFVSPEGRAGRNQAAADSDGCIGPWHETVDRVHASGTKIVLQLAHAGGAAADAASAVGPSPFVSGRNRPPCREASAGEIAHIVRNFAEAALRAKRAGFDGVQLHAAHGYLISQFLSGFYNHRSDAYGGTPENRARLLLEILGAVRTEVGRDYPVLAKINCEDFAPGGFSAAECIRLCRELERHGLDAVELSGGIPEAGPLLSPVRTVDPQPDGPVYYEEYARELRRGLSIPLLLVGGIRDAAAAERLLAEEICDGVSLSRPLIRDPEIVRRWLAGETARSTCVSCNGCFRPILTGRGLFCPRDQRGARNHES